MKTVIVIALKAPFMNNVWQRDVSTISTDPLDNAPFNMVGEGYYTEGGPRYLSLGDMCEETWAHKAGRYNFKSLYQNHPYELATVIGIEENDLLVCGTKINKMIIPGYRMATENKFATFGINRNDKLLLKQELNGAFKIIHNITQAKMAFNAMLNSPKMK